MSLTQDYFFYDGRTKIGDVLQTYVGAGAGYWWLLVTERGNEYFVCSFGSLLPYLTGQTDHIVHNIGDCVICSSVAPLFWKETNSLVKEALHNPGICQILVSDLPLAELPVIDPQSIDERYPYWRYHAALVKERGEISGVHILQMRGIAGGVPEF